MKRSTLIRYPLAVCLAVVFGASAAAKAPAAAKSPQTMRVEESEKIYASQDKRAADALKLAADGKYDDGIATLEGVVAELELESQNVDSWKARSRFREYSAKLREMRLEYGKKLLVKADNSYADGRYDDAISFASQAKNVCDELTPRSNEIIAASQSRKRAATFREKSDPENMDPNLKEREKKISLLLASARNLMKAEKFEDASLKVEEIFTINPFNAEAAQLANEIYKNYYVRGYRKRQADNAGILAKEAWQWVEPTFPRGVQTTLSDGNNGPVADDYAIQAKLDRIVFPTVRFNDTEISSVLKKLQADSRRYDSADGKGVVIDFSNAKAPGAAEKKTEEQPDVAANPDEPAPAANAQTAPQENAAGDILVTLNADNVTLRQVLNYICYLTHLSYTVQNDRVILGFINTPYPARYDISFGVLTSVDNYDKGIDAKATKADDAEGGESSPAASSGTSVSPEALKKFFELYGVSFPDGSKISVTGNRLSMTNTEENHRKLRSILQELNVDKPMVQIEVKSIELTEADMEELGFNWSLNTISSIGFDSRKNSDTGKGNYTGWQAGPGSNTKYDTSDGESAILSMLGNTLGKASGGVDSRLIENLNIFPDILGSVKPFGSDVRLNLSLTINALDRSDRTEMISAPRVLVNSGEEASVVMGKRYYFPESWDTLEIEVEDSQGYAGRAFTLTLPTPTFGESQTMGTVFTVTPTVLEDNRIRLSINPKLTAYIGRDEYTLNVLVYRQGRLSPDESIYGLAIWRPVIATRSLDVQVDVNHGETLVLGGVSQSISESRLDKIPILADIPFIGRLFQSHSEMSTRRNMLMFVTAKLMDASGNPIRNLDSNFGMPDAGR